MNCHMYYSRSVIAFLIFTMTSYFDCTLPCFKSSHRETNSYPSALLSFPYFC